MTNINWDINFNPKEKLRKPEFFLLDIYSQINVVFVETSEMLACKRIFIKNIFFKLFFNIIS